MLWHFTGRQSFQPMLDNGFVLEEKKTAVLTLNPLVIKRQELTIIPEYIGV
ncbi:MAG: hypothetical protein R6W85_07270 [Gillisia sp.]